jgi:hypothetical protein
MRVLGLGFRSAGPALSRGLALPPANEHSSARHHGPAAAREKRVYASGDWPGDKALEEVVGPAQTRQHLNCHRQITADGWPLKKADEAAFR